MKRTLLSIALPFVFIVALVTTDLTGTWKGTVNYQGTQLELTYKLKAEGTVLTGTVTSSYGEIPLTDGKISGNDFSYKIDVGNGPHEATGKYYGDSIVIVSAVTGLSNTFKRVAE
jgi:hypothetical protein